MSEVIDSRIVEMRFDNSQFESNVRESLKTIDNLKSSLNFEDSVKGLDKLKVDIDASGAIHGLNAISDAAAECDLSALNDSAESVKLSFSALEVIAVTALGKIASAAIDAGAKAVKAFAIQPITDGFAEYNQQLKSTRVITSNTGQELEEVTRILDDLNEYADKTIYSFGDMTQAMGYFTSALGENSAQSAATIAKGVSNWAASTGQGNQVAKRVMYQISQALSTGAFRLMDWKSIENTGAMAGQRYQKAFIETAQEMYGYTIDEIMVDKSGKPVTSFRDSLQSGWLTNDIFLETMRRFANETDILNEKGERAFQWMEDAATKVLTFSDLMDTVREQLGTGWGETWKIVFGNFEESITFFTAISERISDFINHVNDARNAIVQAWSDSGGRLMLFDEKVGAIPLMLDSVINLLKQVHDGFIDGFGSEAIVELLQDITFYISYFASELEKISRLTIIHDVIKSISSVLGSLFHIVKNLFEIVKPFLDLALLAVEKILAGVSKITNVVANFVNLISTKVAGLSDILSLPFQIASETIYETFGGILDFVSDKFSGLWNGLKKFDVFGLLQEGSTDPLLQSLDKVDSKVNITADNAEKRIKSVKDRLADLGITINSEEDLKGEGWQDIFWNAMNEEKKRQHFAVELWEEVKKTDDLINGDTVASTWLDTAIEGGFFDPGVYEELSDIWKQWARVGEYENLILDDTTDSLEKVTDKSEDQVNTVIDGIETLNSSLEETEKKSREVTGTWWDLIKENDKQRYFTAEYWDDLTEAQKEGWKQYALGLGLFTKEELEQLESTQKSVDDILDDRDRLVNKKKKEAQTWWDLISEDNKKQYFAGEFWDELTDEQREAWRQRAEEYKLYDPEEYARLLEEMNAAEQAAFSQQNTQEIVESATGLETWFDKASKIPVVGGFLEKIGWAITKTVSNTKSFASAVGTSFGGFFNFVKLLNQTDYSFSKKFELASLYFKEHVSDYLGELIVKNFKMIGDVLSKNTIVSKLSSFTSAVKDRFGLFKDYVKEINQNAELTFPEKFRLSLDYFKTNVVDYLGQLVGKNLKQIAIDLTSNKIVSNITSLVNAGKTKFGEFKAYIADLNANTELTFPEKLERSLSFLKTNVIDYFLELINKNLKSIGIDIEKIGQDISRALTNAATFIDNTLKRLGINTEAIRKFFWDDDGTLKSIPEIISSLGDEIEKALNEVKTKLLAVYENFFPSKENGELSGPLGWLASLKKNVEEFIASIFGSKEELENTEAKGSKGGLLAAALGVLGVTSGSSIMKTIGNMNSIFTFGKNVGVSGSLNFGKIALGIGLATGAFALLSRVDFTKLGIDFKSFTDYFKDGEGNLLSVSEIFGKVGDSLSNSKIITWISDTATLIGKNASSAFGLLKEKSLYFGEFLKVLNETDLSFPEKFSYAVKFFKEQFIDPFGELTKKNLKTIGIDLDAFTNYFKDTEGNWLSIGEVLGKAANKISEAFKKTEISKLISEKFENFKTNNPEIIKWFDSLGDSVAKVANRIGDSASLIGRNAGTAFGLLKEKAVYFGDFLKTLNETDLSFPEKFRLALQFFREQFVTPFGELAKKNLKTIGIDLDAFTKYFKDNEGNWLSIGDIISKVGNRIHDTFSELKSRFEQSKFAKWIGEKLELIRSKFDGSSEWLRNFSNTISRYLVPILAGGAIAFVISRFGQLFDFVVSIGQAFSGRTPVARANAFAIRLQALVGIIRGIAVSVMMIAGTIAGLSYLNQDDLARAAESLANIMRAITVFVVAFGVMAAINCRAQRNAKSATTAILEIAASILLITAAFAIITAIPKELGNIAASFGILLGLMIMVSLFARFTPALQGSKSAFLGMVGIATAVLEMVGALYLIQLMIESHRGVGWALLVLIGLVGTFALLCLAARGVNWKAGLGLILMARSMRTMLDSLEYVLDSDLLGKFGNNWQERVANIGKILIVLASLAALSLINRISGGGRAGLNLLGVAASVLVLVRAIEMIIDIPTDDLWRAVIVVSILSIVMGGIMVAYSALNKGVHTSIGTMITTTIQLYSVVIGVLLLCAAVAVLSTIEQSSLITAGAVVGGLTAVVGLIAIFLGRVSAYSSFSTALGLIGTVTAVAILMGGLIWALDHYIPDKSNLLQIAGAVATLTIVVGSFAILFGIIQTKYRNLGDILGILAEMSGVVLVMAFILTMMARSFPENMDNGKLWSIVGAVSVLTAVTAGLSALFGRFIKIDLASAGKAAAAMFIFGAVIEILTILAGVIYGWQGDNIEKVVSLVERIGAGMTKIFDSVISTLGKLNWWQFIGVMTVIAGAVVAAAAVGLPIAINLGSIILIVGLISEAIITIAALIYGRQGENIEKVVTLLGRVCRGFVKIFDSIMTSIGKLNWWQLASVVVVFGVAIAALASGGAYIGANLGIFAVEMAAAAVIVVGILDAFLPAFEKFANEGIPVFEKIASGIASIASIIIDSIVANVKTIIQCIRDFSDFAANNFDAEKTREAIGVAKQLTEVIGAFVGDNFFDALGKFIKAEYFDAANRETFKENVNTLTEVLDSFRTHASSWNPIELGKAEIATDIADKLATVCNKFTGETFTKAFIAFVNAKTELGAANREAFKENIKTVGTAIAIFCAIINTIPSLDLVKAESVMPIADQMIGLVNKFTPSNLGELVMEWFNSLIFNPENFKKNVINLTDAISTFCTEVGKWIIPEDYEDRLSIADKLIEFCDKMPALASASDGKMRLDEFGEMVKEFSKSFIAATYYLNSALSKSGISDYDGKMALMDDLIALTNKLPRVTGSMQKFIGFNITQTLGNFATDVNTFGTNLKEFATAMDGITPINNWEGTKTVIADLIELSESLPKVNSIGEEAVGYNLNGDFGKFGSQIASFTTSFGVAIDKINGLSINAETFTKFGQMKKMVSMLAELAKELPQSFSQQDASGNSSMIVSTFTQSFTDFMNDIVGSKKNSLFDKVQTVYEELDDLGEFSEDRKNKLDSLVGSEGALQKLADFANNIPEFTNDSNVLSNFGVQLTELSQDIADAAETLSSNNSGSEYKFDPQPLIDLGTSINSIVSSFGDVDTERLGHMASIMDSLSGILTSDNNRLGFSDLFSNLVGGLLGDPFNKIDTAVGNAQGLGGILQNLGGLGDLLTSITPEGGFNMESFTQMFGSIGTNGEASGGILSIIPASLTSFTGDMPTEEAITTAMNPLTNMFSGITSDTFNFDALSPLLGNFTPGVGFDDSGFIQMMPVELQEYLQTMGGEDGTGYDITGVNSMITDLVSGVSEAGSITPDLATNFNDTLSAFANNGISSYIAVFDSPETEIQLNDAGALIVSKTGAGIESALDSNPNKLQTASKSAVQLIADILSGDNTNPYNAPGIQILNKTGLGIDMALANSSLALKNSVQSVVKFIVKILSGNDNTNPYNAPGGSIIVKTADGIKSALSTSSYLLKNAASSVVSVIVNVLAGSSGSVNPYVSAGKNVISGFVQGMVNTQSVYTAAYEVGRAAVTGLQRSIVSNSPSKEAMKYGNYFSEGFEIGISSYSDVVRTASENVGNEAVLGLASYVGKVYDLLDSDLDTSPRITPVLDLSEIQNGVGSLNALFSKQQAYSTNMEVTGALRARSDAMKTVNSTTDNSRNFGGFTFNIYTQGTDANAIAKQIGVEVARKIRGTGNLI